MPTPTRCAATPATRSRPRHLVRTRVFGWQQKNVAKSQLFLASLGFKRTSLDPANYSSPADASPEGRVARPFHKARAALPGAGTAAAALPLLAPPFGVRPAIAIDVPTCSLQLLHVHATVLHNFHLDQQFHHWRMVSYINMAKPFMRYELRFAAVG